MSLEFSDIKLLKILGTGTFGKCYLCQNRRTGDFMAMKVLKKLDVVRLKQVEHIISERDILFAVKNPFVVELYQTYQDEENLYMCMEYASGGELFSHLRKAGSFDTATTQFYASEIVHALEYMHKRDIVYRDLKPENILLDKDGHVKITDFGFAKHVKDKTWTLCGTPEYLAPEIITGRGHSKAVDWWALGILIYEMLAGYPPFFDDNPFGIYEKILKGHVHFPSHFDPAAKNLIRRLLTIDVMERAGSSKDGAEDIKRHKWFQGVDWDNIQLKKRKAPIVPAYGGPGSTLNFEEYPEDEDEENAAQMARMAINPSNERDPFGHLFKGF